MAKTKTAPRTARRPAPKAKTAKETAKAPTPPALVPQPNGKGALYAGGVPGNAGGSGRPPSELRELMRGKLADRLHVIEAIADGEMVEQAQVPLSSVLRYAHCPKCNTGLKANDVAEALMVTISGKVSPKAKDRKEAVDLFAKYGLGTTKEISIEDVKGRMANSLEAVRSLPYPVTSAEQIIAVIRPFWTAGR